MGKIKLIGWDRETKRPIWRTIYYNLSLILFLSLSYNAFFVQKVFNDNWGLSSIYLFKLSIVGIILFLIYFVWEYYQLISRVSNLERQISKIKTTRRLLNYKIKMKTLKEKDKEKNDYLFAIISFSLCITLTFLPLYLFKEFIKSTPLWFQPILIIIFGIGGIGLYVILGFRLREIQLKMEKMKNEK